MKAKRWPIASQNKNKTNLLTCRSLSSAKGARAWEK